MSKNKVRVGIIGVGNCASSLAQGVQFYKNAKDEDQVPGLMHVNLGGYHVRDIEFTAYGQLYTSSFNFEVVALRYFNAYGPRQRPDSMYAAAVPIFIDRALKNLPITIYGDGEQTRDFIYVKDIAAANAFFAIESQATGVFNAAYGGRITINDLATSVCRLTGSRSEIQHAAERPGDVRHSQAAIDRLRSAGFSPTGSLMEGLQATVEFFQGRSK